MGARLLPSRSLFRRVGGARLSIFPVLKLTWGERTVLYAGPALRIPRAPGQNRNAAAKASRATDADPCDLFREPTCLRCHKKNGVKPDQPKWGPDRCTAENDKRDWFAVFCPGTGDADVDEDAFDPEAPVGNIQPVTVGSGQIPVIPLPAPPPPCDIAA